MAAKEFHDVIETKATGGNLVPLVRRGHLVPSQPRGERLKNRSTPIRYELETGEPVEHLRTGAWRHPLSGGELLFVGFGRTLKSHAFAAPRLKRHD